MTYFKRIGVAPFMELQLKLENDDSFVEIILREGTCNIFGSELQPHKPYKFSCQRCFPVYTYTGCCIEANGKGWFYRIDTNDMTQYHLSIAASLEHASIVAQQSNTHGPKVLVAGPSDMGKSSLCKFLINCAVRYYRSPTFIDIDVGQNAITLPGTLAMVNVSSMLDPVLEFDGIQPYALHHGYKNIQENFRLYLHLIRQLSIVYHAQASSQPAAKYSGCIINTCGWVTGPGYDAIVTAASEFEVQYILVIGDEELSRKLQRSVPKNVSVILMPKSGGVIERTRGFRRQSRVSKVTDYFQGVNRTLQTFRIELSFDNFTIYNQIIKQNSDEVENTAVNHNVEVESVEPHMGMKDSVLSVMAENYPNGKPEDSNIRAYVIVSDINLETKKITLISPMNAPERLQRFLIMSYNAYAC